MNQIDKDALDELVGCVARIAAEMFQDEKVRADFEAWQKERQSGERLPMDEYKSMSSKVYQSKGTIQDEKKENQTGDH